MSAPKASIELERELEPRPRYVEEDDIDEIGRPEGTLEERHIDPFGVSEGRERVAPAFGAASTERPAPEPDTDRDDPPAVEEPEGQSGSAPSNFGRSSAGLGAARGG